MTTRGTVVSLQSRPGGGDVEMGSRYQKGVGSSIGHQDI